MEKTHNFYQTNPSFLKKIKILKTNEFYPVDIRNNRSSQARPRVDELRGDRVVEQLVLSGHGQGRAARPVHFVYLQSGKSIKFTFFQKISRNK